MQLSLIASSELLLSLSLAASAATAVRPQPSRMLEIINAALQDSLLTHLYSSVSALFGVSNCWLFFQEMVGSIFLGHTHTKAFKSSSGRMHQVQQWQLWLTDIGPPIDGSFEKVHERERTRHSPPLPFLDQHAITFMYARSFKLLLALLLLQNLLCFTARDFALVLMGRTLKG